MRRALSLFALGCTLFMASAVPSIEVEFSTIRAVNTPSVDKDSWSFKGVVTGASGDYLDALLEYGIDLSLSSSVEGHDGYDVVTFDADDCRLIRKETGASCKTDGARFTVTEVRT